MYAVLRQAKPSLQGDSLLLEFKFAFHNDRANEQRNRKVVERIAAQVLKRQVSVKTEVNERLEVVAASLSSEGDVKSVIDLMGGGDIMEYKDG